MIYCKLLNGRLNTGYVIVALHLVNLHNCFILIYLYAVIIVFIEYIESLFYLEEDYL